jgi:hypothetical protein
MLAGLCWAASFGLLLAVWVLEPRFPNSVAMSLAVTVLAPIILPTILVAMTAFFMRRGDGGSHVDN